MKSRFSVLLFVLIVLAFGIWLEAGHSATTDSKSPTKATHTTPARAVAINDSQEEQAIAAAQNYLSDTLPSVATPQRLILDFLQRKYQLLQVFSAQKTPITGWIFHQKYTNIYDALWRIAYPDQVTKDIDYTGNDSIDLMLVLAANCDQLSIPSDYAGLLQKNADAGGYATTHVVFALGFMQDNKCQLPSNASSVRAQVLASMTAMLDDPQVTPDLRYEALAFLQEYGTGVTIQPKYIDQVLKEQNANGSWSPEVGSPPTDHATVLALWALLLYARPHAPNEPIIRPAAKG
jgi:hypothetical protein